MNRRTMFACALFAAQTVTSLVLAADANFAGTWSLNLTKSHLSGALYTLEKQASGVMHYSGGGFDADFDLAGKVYTMPSGTSVVGKELSPTSWELTFGMNGKTLSKSKVTLNGNSLTWVSDATGPDGKTVQQTSVDTRVSGGPGFVGKWKSGDLKGAATTMKIARDGANGITLEFVEGQTVCTASFDGKDYPVMTGGQASKFTYAFTKTPTTFTVTTKLSGKEFATDVYALSADGKTLTDDSTATATKEKTQSVFDKR